MDQFHNLIDEIALVSLKTYTERLLLNLDKFGSESTEKTSYEDVKYLMSNLQFLEDSFKKKRTELHLVKNLQQLAYERKE